MAYTVQTWADNDPSKPVSAARMNHIEAGLDAVANGGSQTVPDYLVYTSGSTVIANALSPGLASYSGPSTDAAAVMQLAVNQLVSVQNYGCIAFRGALTFATQLAIYPNISLIGEGAPGYKPVSTPYGNVITSTYNGSAILLSGNVGNSTFTYFSNFSLYGNNGGSLPNQNGIEINASAGVIKDIFFEHLFIDQMGKWGIYFNGSAAGTPKLWCHNVMIEYCASDGIHHVCVANGGGKLVFSDGYITNNTGNGYDGSGLGSNGAYVEFVNTEFNSNAIGIVGPYNPTEWGAVGCKFSSNSSEAISFSGSSSNGGIGIVGNHFSNNGANGGNQINGSAAAAASNLNITGNTFTDTRGASAVNNHINLAVAGTTVGQIVGNTFYGSQQDAIIWTSRAANKLIIKANRGYNDTKGKITNAFAASNRIGAAGTTAAPTASTAYAVEGADVYVVSTGGTGVSITITDAGGNTITSGLTTFTGLLPVGFSINFGAFSVAPTLYVGVV